MIHPRKTNILNILQNELYINNSFCVFFPLLSSPIILWTPLLILFPSRLFLSTPFPHIILSSPLLSSLSYTFPLWTSVSSSSLAPILTQRNLDLGQKPCGTWNKATLQETSTGLCVSLSHAQA